MVYLNVFNVLKLLFDRYCSVNSTRLFTMAGKKGRKCIGTHNGNFHCDEVLACFMLKQLSEYKDAEIVRYLFVCFSRRNKVRI